MDVHPLFIKKVPPDSSDKEAFDIFCRANRVQIAMGMYPEITPDESVMAEGITILYDNRSKGLGDTVAKITEVTGLKALAELYTEITGKDCGCSSRQEALNRLFPYGVKENGV